jgi:aminoglycoside phosphotransferase (APT) family kinase protein
MDIEAIVQAVNAQGAGTFTLGEQLAGGESGHAVFRLTDQLGRRYVLKCGAGGPSTDRWRTVMRTLTVLRERGYPAPAHVAAGESIEGSYVVQELLPGAPVRRFTVARLPALLNLNTPQAEAAPAELLAGPAWPAPAIEPVLRGGDGYCMLESLQQHSATTVELLTTVQAFAAGALNEPYRTTDIVHFDCSPGNVLAQGETLTGVMDWNAACAGDRCFDLVTALFYSYEDPPVRDRLWTAVLELANPRVTAAYLAHMILRQVDWSLRHHPAADVAYWLRVAGAVVADVRNLTRR